MTKSYIFTRITCDTLTLDDPLWTYLPKANLDCYHFSPSKSYPVTSATGVCSDEGLTVKFDTNERPSDILARYHGKNEPVCTDSCVEFFFKPDPANDPRYLNFELSAGGGLLIQVGTDRHDRRPLEFELETFRIETKITCCGWKAKLFIPYSFIKQEFADMNPKFEGNFYKCGDDTACRHYPVWNKVDVPHPDYHRPEFFGKLFLGNLPSGK